MRYCLLAPLIFKWIWTWIIYVGWCWSCGKDAFCSARKKIWLWSKTGSKILAAFSGQFDDTNQIHPTICCLKVIVLQLRFTGDLLMELGAGVELATAAVPHLFLPLACAANVLKVWWLSFWSVIQFHVSFAGSLVYFCF